MNRIGTVNIRSVALKSGPQLSSDTIAIYPTLSKGNKVEILKEVIGGFDERWYYIATEHGVNGYVKASSIIG